MPARFIQIVAAIEQFADLKTMSFQKLSEGLKPMRTHQEAKQEEDTHDGLLYAKQTEKRKIEHKIVNAAVIERRGSGRNWKSWRNKDGNRHQQDKSEIKCFKCNKFGHFKYECPKKEEEVNLAQYKDDDLIGQTLL
ncbi:hypothetical protein OSB04_un001082 [Centaurea solstitialis]|uniref:CCHC-type domain-containing protein n=1 Tax=Centaurea solstitialis TaxID=347529 RepID=A0AA38S4Q0_9ASTR|nr:hypothetical protein OSB04_un001082 [Centaurea solstitialis]